MSSRLVLDRYELGSRLGRGASASVYAGRSLRTGASVAIKLCNQLDGVPKARFHREAELLARVMHPNVVRIMDFGELPDGTQVIVMEHIDGESLSAVLRDRERLPWREACDVMCGVLSGLEALHDAGIVHRDLKPSNVLVERGVRPTVKLIDLGVSREMVREPGRRRNPITAVGAVVGSLAYMAPEQLMAEEIDARSDLYAAGAMLYELLSSELPFDGPPVIAAASKVQFEGVDRVRPLEPEADWPAGLVPFVHAMLRRDKRQRPESALDGLQRLRAMLAGRDAR